MHALAGETEGNPFFIEEVVRHIRDTSGALSEEMTLEEAGVPDGVREVTARRLRRLTEPTRAVLLVASVIGREFDYDILQAVVSQSGDELVEALEEGVEARVLREVGHVGRYGFTHALVRATLYDSISQLRRARLHGRVGEVLVRLRGGDLDPHLAMLAHHFAQAAPVERPDRAIDFALAAARRADRMLAWEEAAHALPRRAAGARAGRRGRRPRARRAAARARRLRGSRRARGGGARDVPGRDPHRPPARRSGAAVPRRAGRGRAVVGVEPLRSGARVVARGGVGGAPGRGLAAARAAARADVARALLRGRARAAAVAVGGGDAGRVADRRPAHARDLPRRAPLRAVAAGERRGAARGGGGAAARGGGDRRSRARAAGRRLDDHRPDGARRHPGRRHPDRGGVQARRGPAPADLAVVDVAVPRARGRSWTATSTRPSG